MVTEQCAVCDSTFPFAATVHLLIHTNTEAGVIDYYICRNCYEERIEPLFESDATEADASPDDPAEDDAS